MSKRSLKKRRHRDDFQEYVQQTATNKLTDLGPLWKRAGFASYLEYQEYLKTKPKDGPEYYSLPQTHVHGPECGHSVAQVGRAARLQKQIDAQVDGTAEPDLQNPRAFTDHAAALSQAEADAMTDEEWLNEKRLTAEEKAAIESADSEEGEEF